VPKNKNISLEVEKTYLQNIIWKSPLSKIYTDP
jgi:hypothetical protein